MENYSSYILGSVNSVKDCLTIVLYKKSSFIDKISLYNIRNFYNTYLIADNNFVVHISRLDPNKSFKYLKNLRGGFDTIVYLDSSTNLPIGYTEYVYIQGTSRSLDIKLDIKSRVEEIVDTSSDRSVFVIINNLVDQSLTKRYNGDELYNYPTISEVIGKSHKNNYTTDVEKALNDKNSSIVLSKFVLSKDNIWRLDINRDIDLKTNLIGYNEHRICYYGGDLVVACWKRDDISLTNRGSIKYLSLLERNQLGYPIVKEVALNLPEMENLGYYNIDKVFGKYYTINGKLYDVDNIDSDGNNNPIGNIEDYFIDFYNKDNELYKIKEINRKSDALKYIPELNNIYLDLDNYLLSQPIIVCGKFSNWFILKQQYKGKNLFLAVSPLSCLYFTEEDMEKLIYVNDQTIILKEVVEEENKIYYIIYSKPNSIFYTERARSIVLSEGEYRLDSDTGIWMYMFYDEEKNIDHFLDYYSDNNKYRKADLVYDSEELLKTVLNRYRKSLYPKTIGIPDIVESYCGIIFYRNEDKDKLNYL